MRRMLSRSLEQLENRRLLTVAAEVIAGDLLVSGTPDGPVAIVATGSESFDIFDDGELVFSIEGVNDDLRINLDDSEELADQTVELDLAAADVDRVSVDMGDGFNRLVLAVGATRGSVQFNGGAGVDELEVASDFAIGGGLTAQLRDGDNTADLRGSIGRNLELRSGNGDDLFTLGSDLEVGGRATMYAGNGENTAIVDGLIEGAFYFRGGNGDDLVDIGAEAQVQGRATMRLEGGNNSLGIEGTLGSHLNAFGGSGDDVITIAETAAIEGNARLRLGSGDNVLTNDGEIGGHLLSDPSIDSKPTTPPEAPTTLAVDATLQLIELLKGQFSFRGTGELM